MREGQGLGMRSSASDVVTRAAWTKRALQRGRRGVKDRSSAAFACESEVGQIFPQISEGVNALPAPVHFPLSHAAAPRPHTRTHAVNRVVIAVDRKLAPKARLTSDCSYFNDARGDFGNLILEDFCQKTPRLVVGRKCWGHGRYCRNQRRCDSPSGFSGTVTAQSSRVPPVEVVVLQEPPVGFEPTTARLRIESSTTELRWRPPNLATCCATRYSASS